MTILCGTEWGAPWGSHYGPCDPTDIVALVMSEGRSRLLEGTTFASMVQLIGEAFEGIEHDAWLLAHLLNISTAPGAILDALGENVGLARMGVWTDAYYRRVLGAWIACSGKSTIPRLMTLLAALSDGGVAYTVDELLPNHVWIDLVGLDQDAASIWVDVLEGSRPKGVQYWVSYSVVNPAAFILDESYLDGPDALVGMFVL